MVRTRVRIGLVCGVAAALVAIPAAAVARFSAPGSAATPVSAATMNPPTNVQVTASCSKKTATLTWTATTDVYATGYLMPYTADGAPGSPQPITGRTTTTLTYSISKGVAYRFAMQSTYRTWTSAPTAYTAAISC